MNATARIFAILVVVGSMCSLAKADGIDFAGFSGGTVTFTPAVGQAVQVSNAPINLLYLLSNPGAQYSVSGGALNFVTGAATSMNAGMYAFGAGSSPQDLTITGTVFNGATQVASGTLLTGNFLGGSGQFGNGIGNLGGLFNITSLNSALMVAVFGSVPQGPAAGTLGQVLFNLQLNPSGSYSGTIGSTNLIASIPEPESLLLLGSGLLLGAGLLRRTLEKRQVA